MDGRLEIWANFINGLRDSNVNAKVDELRRKVDVLAHIELNGRQIRNTVTTAMQLAYFRHEPLEYTHFERVIEVVREFEDYLESTNGYTTSQLVQHLGLR